MGADKELWKTGKSAEDLDAEDGGTLDLSTPSPDVDEDVYLDKSEDSKETDEDDWLPLLEENNGVSIRTV